MFFPKNTICTCGKCGNLFNYEDATISYRKLYGLETKEKSCPNCGSIGFTIEQHKNWLNSRHKELNYLL